MTRTDHGNLSVDLTNTLYNQRFPLNYDSFTFPGLRMSQSGLMESPHYNIIPKRNQGMDQLWESDNNE